MAVARAFFRANASMDKEGGQAELNSGAREQTKSGSCSCIEKVNCLACRALTRTANIHDPAISSDRVGSARKLSHRHDVGTR